MENPRVGSIHLGFLPLWTLMAVHSQQMASRLRITPGFRRAPLAARRPASRCSVARASEVHRPDWLVEVIRPVLKHLHESSRSSFSLERPRSAPD
jgi:hypothetical protein